MVRGILLCMKQNNQSVQNGLKELLRNYPTKADLRRELTALEKKIVRVDIKLESLGRDVDEKARKYRDEILSRIDDVMGQLETLREENVIGAHQTREFREQVDGHERRLVRLENPHKQT